MTGVAAAAAILLWLLTSGASAEEKFFLGRMYEEIDRCPQSAWTARGSEFALRTPGGQGCIPMGRNQEIALSEAGWANESPVVFLIHNSKGNAWDAWIQASQYHLVKRFCNVFAFNWKTGGRVSKHQHGHASIAKAAAEDLAVFIRNLIDAGSAREGDIHLVGFGQGAHVAGFAGKELGALRLETPSILIGRITGLDPAGLGFENTAESARLHSTDAKLVVVIHTNAFDQAEKARLKDPFIKTLGISERIGDVDFYPNGGMLQPGCRPTSSESHRKATEFFFVSLEPEERLFGLPCPDYAMFTSGG